jgi:hypothetical protein
MLLSIAARLRRKARAARVALTPEDRRAPPLRLVSASPPASPLHRTLRQWAALQVAPPDASRPTHSASVHDDADTTSLVAVLRGAPRAGWLAATHDEAGPVLCGGWFTGGERRTRAVRDPRALGALVACATAALATAEASAHAHEIAHGDGAHDDRSIHHPRHAALRAIRAQRTRARARTVVDTVQSPQHRAQRALRELLASTSLTSRLALAPRVAEASRVLRSLRGAGDERALLALLAHVGEPDTVRWLDALIALGGSSVRDAPVPPAPLRTHDVSALLLLLP